ncbi:SpaH/EbpB family LPXTG-anchored major pilin [Eubacterium ramulus]|uniref:Predicted outer membrane protein n=1 Tax=Eubacterium ramulus TaxID=39490 RepID=A0A173SQY7_EUBRA|nr:SpaH/EbpB family LPXTG-anchored major pilin [Eubacterium ramulus]CUM92129.1 Predicted outer membrane protein [Eubacterium ramulus]
MKKMKKILAVILSLAMVLGMSITAFAAKTGATLEVKGLATYAEQKVDIYEIYRLDANDNGWVAADWTKDTGVTPETLNTEAVISKLKTEALKTTATATKNSKEISTGKFASNVNFENLQAGAYLVIVTDSVNKTEYSTMVAKTYKYDEKNNLIAPLDASVVAKAKGYHTGKEADKTNAEVGDLVTYKVKTTVPYQEVKPNGQKLVTEFKVSDNLTGATFYLKGDPVKGTAAVNTITVNGVTVEGFAKLDESLHGQSSFNLDLMGLVKDDNTYAGQEVVITYTALVDKANTVANKATSTQDPKGTTTKTYSGNAKITKLEVNTTHVLKGAEFVVYRMNGAVKEYAVIDANGWITGQWIAETTKDEVPAGLGTTLTTADDGTVTVKGLKAGDYYFKEVVAPDGYSINNNDIAFTMAETTDETTGVVTGVAPTQPELIKMYDSKLSALPSTGGMGTTLFTIAGCAIMVAAAGFFFASRKRVNK